MIKALICALIGHRPSLDEYVLVTGTYDGEKVKGQTLRPCTRCPVFLEVEPL